MPIINRPVWYTDYYTDLNGKLNLSNNVCYDNVLMNEVSLNIDSSLLFKYPDAANLYSKLAQHHNISPEYINIGYGAGDIVYRLMSYFRGYSIAIYTPTYELAHIFANNMGLTVTQSDNLAELSADILYIANPNGVTGKALSRTEIINLSNKFKYTIVDEAYGDFCTIDYSVLTDSLISNIIVIKTLSKSIASPGLRFGYCISNKEFISDFQNHRSSTVVTGFTESIVTDLLPRISSHVTRMVETRKYIENKYETVPSQGNYVLFKNNPNFNCYVKKTQLGHYRMALTDIDTFKLLENDSHSKQD